MKRSLVAALRDPSSGEPLELVAALPAEGEVLSGLLRSPSGRTYPIERGIPVLSSPETFSEGQSETVDTFSFKWRAARDYRKTTDAHYTKWYLDRYGFGSEALLAELLRDKSAILDAGTAHGRDAEMYVRCSTATVYGIDISAGIENAYRDLGGVERLHLVRADLTKLPFAPEAFDFIGCDQVIHHTPDTRASLHHLLTRLRPGGHIAFYVYKKKAPVREMTDDYLRARMVPMSPEECMRVSEQITRLGKVLTDLAVTVDVPEDIPILGIKAGKQDIQRFIYWTFLKCYYNESMDWQSNVVTNFDWYHPLHAHRHTPEEVRTWCDEEGLVIEHFDVQESGISVLARKGARPREGEARSSPT